MYAIGKYNYGVTAGSGSGSGTTPVTVFEVGIGTGDTNRVNALEIYYDGSVIAPGLDNSLIVNPRSLVTKDYVDVVADFTDHDFTGDGTTTTFTVANTLFTKAFVYINGVKQQAGAGNAYTIATNANGTDTDVTFTAAPANGDWVQITTFA